MSDTLIFLSLEHKRIAQLLKVMEEQLEILEAGEKPDQELLQSMVAYLSGHSEQCHHPKEDLLFRKLTRRDPKAVEGLNNLIEEHKELERLTKHLTELVVKMPEQPDVSLQLLRDPMRHFIDCYYNHMSMEEKYFFPTVLRSLTSNDWAEIDFSVFDQADPIFDGAAEQQFSKLHGEIIRLSDQRGKQRATKTLSENESKQLENITSITQFNDMMKEIGTEGQLVKLPKGNYGLKAAERIIMEIPKCSERRASWCAYYFLKGINSIH